jgi:GNAT superfamily N-acetyltransferase
MISKHPDPAARQEIHQRIKSFNDEHSTFHRDIRLTGPEALDLILRDEHDQIVAGLTAQFYWGWLEVVDLWVAETLRRHGLGRQLLQAAEEEAQKRGCTRVWLRTFGFQARGFYAKVGYHQVGVLEDYPPGEAFYWMRKDLEA